MKVFQYKNHDVKFFSIKIIIVSVAVLSILSSLLYSYFGLHYAFEKKKHTLTSFSELLTLTDSMPSTASRKFTNQQKSALMKADNSITSIGFYSFEKDVHIPKTSEKYFFEVMADSSYIFKKEVIFDSSTLGNNQKDTQRSKSEKNPDAISAKGYVVIQMDLAKFKKQWFSGNLFFYIFLILVYSLVALIIIKMFIKPIEQVQLLSNIAHRFIEDDDSTYLPIYNTKSSKSMDFSEFKAIELAFGTLAQKLEASNTNRDEIKFKLDSSLRRQKHGFYRDFQNMITHELNKTVTSVSTGVKILRQQYLGEEQQEALSIVRNGNVRLSSILEQVLLFDKIDNGEMDVHLFEFNSLQLFSDVIDEYKIIAEKDGLILQNEVSHQDYMLEGDVDKIRQVLAILLDNAVKYTPIGSIKVESHMQHFDSSNQWTIRVTDTGIGIDEEYWNDIFVPFFKVNNEINNKQEGIGIGLTLAKQLTELMGGNLSIRSEVDKGSDFELVLPIMDKKQIMARNKLSGVSIVMYQNNDTEVIDLQGMGASVKIFDNIDQTIDYCIDNRIDVLLINSDTNESDATKITNSIRTKESVHRSLILWINPSTNKVVHESRVQSAGIDVVFDREDDKEFIAKTIKHWI